jgi:hypothetical protein
MCTVETASGTMAVQIVYCYRRGSRDIERAFVRATGEASDSAFACAG